MCTPDAFFPKEDENDELTLDERADRYVHRLEGFYAHLASYVGVNAMLVGINLFTSPDVFWAIWPILGWGLQIGGHAVAVFGFPGRADWRERTRAAFLRRHGAGSAAQGLDAGSTEESPAKTDRLRRRIEHLEAIVTSADWELVLDRASEDGSDRKQAEHLAKEVVAG